MAVNPISAPGTAERPAEEAPKPDALGKDAFMKLLMAQMQHQDPLEPADAKEFVTQLSELTGVEQLNTIRERLGALELATIGGLNQEAASMVGKVVEADTGAMRLGPFGPVNTQFHLDGAAEEVTVVIRNSQGREIRRDALGAHAQGQNGYTWDGMDDHGSRMPPGNYTLEVEATSEGGATVAARTRVHGRVSSVSYENGIPEMDVDGTRVRMGDVITISQ